MKSVCLLIVFVLSVSACTAYADGSMGFGFKLGGVAASQKWQDPWRDDTLRGTRWGFIGGVFIHVLDWSNLSFVVEFDYVQKGTRFKFIETDPSGVPFPRRSPRVDYLSIPLLAKIHKRVAWLTPYIIVGPRVDIPLNTDSDGSIMWSSLDIGDVERIDLGGVVGLGLERLAHPVTLLVEFRYSPSFTDAVDTERVTFRNSSIELLLGVHL